MIGSVGSAISEAFQGPLWLTAGFERGGDEAEAIVSGQANVAPDCGPLRRRIR